MFGVGVGVDINKLNLIGRKLNILLASGFSCRLRLEGHNPENRDLLNLTTIFLTID